MRKETRSLNKIIPGKINVLKKIRKSDVLNSNLGYGQEKSYFGSNVLAES